MLSCWEDPGDLILYSSSVPGGASAGDENSFRIKMLLQYFSVVSHWAWHSHLLAAPGKLLSWWLFISQLHTGKLKIPIIFFFNLVQAPAALGAVAWESLHRWGLPNSPPLVELPLQLNSLKHTNKEREGGKTKEQRTKVSAEKCSDCHC